MVSEQPALHSTDEEWNSDDEMDVSAFAFQIHADLLLTPRHQNTPLVLLNSMAQLMRHDPRRRFVFGMSLETAQVRLWHMDRSITIVSEPLRVKMVCDCSVTFSGIVCSPSLAGSSHSRWNLRSSDLRNPFAARL